jgi:hypothetical protein
MCRKLLRNRRAEKGSESCAIRIDPEWGAARVKTNAMFAM